MWMSTVIYGCWWTRHSEVHIPCLFPAYSLLVPCYNHATAMFIPFSNHATAMFIPFHNHHTAMFIPFHNHHTAMFIPFHNHHTAMLQQCDHISSRTVDTRPRSSLPHRHVMED